jgi:hypothetical protein
MIDMWRDAILHQSRREKWLEFRSVRIYNVETYWQGAAIMEAVIRKWGNSPALRLPVAVIKSCELQRQDGINGLLPDEHQDQGASF